MKVNVYSSNSINIILQDNILICVDTSTLSQTNTKFKIFKNKEKATAIIMAVLTGPIGGHRMSLGCKPIVPIVYALTLGGGFLLLPIIDIIALIVSKDISRFQNNHKILMWLDE